MIKHYCDRCGKEIIKENRVRLSVSLSGALSSPSNDLEYCVDCVKSSFGDEFVADIVKKIEERRARIAQRRAERDAQKEGDEND